MEAPSKQKRSVCLAFAVLCALTTVLVLPSLLCLGGDATHSALSLVIFASLAWTGYRLFRLPEKRLRRYSLVFGLLFGFCQLAGWRLDAAGTLGDGLAPVWLALAAVACSPALGFGFAAFARLWSRPGWKDETPQPAGVRRRMFWLAFALILLCWLPYYLAYFPGMFNYDSGGEAAQFLSGSYDGSFPPFHTLLLGGFYRLGQYFGSPNAGIALYTALQAGALAASMAAAASYLRGLGCRRVYCAVMTAVFALLPFFPLLAMSTTKDIFFSAGLLRLLPALHQVWRDPGALRKPGCLARIITLTALVCLLRLNGAATIVAALAAVLFFPKAGRRRLAIALLCGLALFGGAQYGMKQALKPAPQGIREVLSVPLAQVARVYHQARERGEALPEKDEILAFIPDADRYQRHIADGVKRHTTLGLVNMPEFLSLYGRLLASHPADFADGWAYLTKGYWHLDDVTHLDIYAERGGHGYMETANQDGYGVTRASRWPELESALDRLFVDNAYKDVPLLAPLMEPALWCWLMGAALWLAAYRRNRAALSCGLMLAALYLTLLFGPCSYMRYAFPLALCTPPLLGLCLGGEANAPTTKGDQGQ